MQLILLIFLFLFKLQGYALFGNVLCLFLTTVGYHHSHSFFYALWLVFGGLSAAKLVSERHTRVAHTTVRLLSIVEP